MAGNEPQHTNPPAATSAGNLRLLLVVTWREEGSWYLYRQLKARCRSVEVLQPGPWLRHVPAFAGRVIPALLALGAFARRRRFDAVCSWSTPVGVWYGLLNRLPGSRGGPRHILRDFHLNMGRKDWRCRLRLGLVRTALPGIDTLLCTSREEEPLYARTFALDGARIRFFPDAPPSQFLSVQQAAPVSDYVFACGNSDRDFETLLDAVTGLGLKTVILSQNFKPGRCLPPEVRIIPDRVPMETMQAMIQSAAVVVVPLEHERVAAGQNSLLEAMALGRPVIVTENFATREYARHGRTALLCPAGDASSMAALLRQVFSDRDAAEAMAARAREASHALLDRQVSLFMESLQAACPGNS